LECEIEFAGEREIDAFVVENIKQRPPVHVFRYNEHAVVMVVMEEEVVAVVVVVVVVLLL